MLECLACEHGIGSWLWEQSEASVSALQSAVAAAFKGATSQDKAPSTRGDSAAIEAAQGDKEGDESEEEGDSDEEDGAEGKEDASGEKQAAEAEQAEAGSDLSQNFFATRALKRMASCAQGSCGDSFKTKLWEEAIKGDVVKLKGTHTCKVIAALAQCNVASVEQAAKQELSEALQGEDLDGFLQQFARITNHSAKLKREKE